MAIKNTFLQIEANRILLAYWEARVLDANLVEAKETAYNEQDISRATKLERVAARSQKRLFRRYEDVQLANFKQMVNTYSPYFVTQQSRAA